MLRIAICDDNSTILDYVSEAVTERLENFSEGFSLHNYTDGALLLADNRAERFDILFLDIQMPGIDGFEIAHEVRQQSIDTYVIFISSNNTLVYKSLEYQPFHFICKGNGENIRSDIKMILSRIITRNKRFSSIILTLKNLATKSVVINDILFIENDRHYLNYYMVNGDILLARGEMQAAEEKMTAYDFIRIHRSYLINPFHVDRISMTNNRVTLSGGKTLEIGRTFKNDTAKKYSAFCSHNNM